MYVCVYIYIYAHTYIKREGDCVHLSAGASSCKILPCELGESFIHTRGIIDFQIQIHYVCVCVCVCVCEQVNRRTCWFIYLQQNIPTECVYACVDSHAWGCLLCLLMAHNQLYIPVKSSLKMNACAQNVMYVSPTRLGTAHVQCCMCTCHEYAKAACHLQWCVRARYHAYITRAMLHMKMSYSERERERLCGTHAQGRQWLTHACTWGTWLHCAQRLRKQPLPRILHWDASCPYLQARCPAGTCPDRQAVALGIHARLLACVWTRIGMMVASSPCMGTRGW